LGYVFDVLNAYVSVVGRLLQLAGDTSWGADFEVVGEP
jgi:hypothetical protein